ncbi:hypothetical protein ONE63_009513 [Megalurothrips usitatus]|uniref:TNFR-Cys domain-containing protein n=1 Tax=Megalurothrips usitatus TaxID=439358 RepID=A0AAV7XN71_9NEOP|nr:hypothetical protein ONE63_009513 [Megalurothrips usitatus]
MPCNEIPSASRELRMGLLALSVVAFATVASAARVPCTDDSSCGFDKFCYMRRYCSPCTECSVYQRQGTGACVKDPSHCGDCLPGFEPEILTDGRTRDLCVPVLATTKVAPVEAPLPHTMEVPSDWLWIAPVVACGTFGFAVSLLYWVSKKYQSDLKIQQRTRFMPCSDSNSTSSATLYAPTAPHFETLLPESKEESERCHRGVVYEKANVLQKTSMFVNPVWVRSPPDPSEQGAPIDVVDGPNPPEDFLIEDNTLPSDWTPGTQHEESSGTASGPLITSFEGILRLNSAANGAGGPQPEPTNHTSAPESASQINVTNITVINNGPSNTGICNITKT